MDTQQLAEFGHAVYQVSDGQWFCDHRDHGCDFEDTREAMERRCKALAADAYETEMLRDGTHPTLGDYDGSGR